MIGIIGAMDEEVEQLVEAMTVKSKKTKAQMTFYTGELCGKDVTIVRCGIGKVNAAVCTQILCDDYDVSSIVNTGIAGSLDPAIDIADVVVSDNVLHHDMDAVGFGYEKGQVPRMDVFSFKADEGMIEAALKACESAELGIGIHKGRVVSGDQFVSRREKKDEIVQLFKGMCTEMEGAAIGHTSYLNGIPFVIIRTISDKADDSASIDYPTFEKLAIKNSVEILKKFCEIWG